MKHLKITALAATTAMALMALVGAGSASAAAGTLCSTATNPCSSRWAAGTILDFSSESGTSMKQLTTEGTTIDTCTGLTIKTKLTSNPGGTTLATSENTQISLTGCTVTTDATKLGKLKFEAEDSSGNGWVYADEEIKWTFNLSIFGDCEYGLTAGTRIGTVKEGGTITINAVIKRLNACIGPETELWSGALTLGEPTSTTLYVSTS